jgi:hypothetical protein
LFSLSIDVRVSLDGNIKAQVIKALNENVRWKKKGNMHSNLIRKKKVIFNQVIRFEYICIKRDFLNKEDLSWCREEMDHSKFFKELMIIPIK